jgi:hypothetical protein
MTNEQADTDARELLEACSDAVDLLQSIQTQDAREFPETRALALAVERAEPVHDGKRITGREFVYTSPRVGPELMQAALKPLAEGSHGLWEELPEGTFAGTGVHAVLAVFNEGLEASR